MSASRPIVNTTDSTKAVFDPYKARADFPILHREVNGYPLAYLDNAATSQKPQCVIDATSRYYAEDNANVHRGLHALSERATAAYEGARERIRTYLNAGSGREIVYTSGTTAGINLVAQSFVRPRLAPGDEVIITHMEHHSNIVPWQLVCEATGAKLRVVPVNDAGELLLEEYYNLLGPRTRFVSVVFLSNALGTINPIREIIDAAHRQGVEVLLDGAQAAQHLRIDVRSLDCDFFVFSGHKTYGPTGIGILYGRESLLDRMPPYQGGGDMIKAVTFEQTLFNELPYKFEAGTPNIAGAIGLAAAIDYVDAHGIEPIDEHERKLLAHATAAVTDIPGVRVIGTAAHKTAVLSFVVEGIHPHDLGTVLDSQGVAIRAGHHCAMPLMSRFGVPATARASFGLYNVREDIDALLAGIHRARELFGR
jgi:cysteine desulfurase/selenocysteine lyase